MSFVFYGSSAFDHLFTVMVIIPGHTLESVCKYGNYPTQYTILVERVQ